MSAVSPALLDAIKLLQELPSLKESALGGGTSLALRFNHRQSIDIDLMFSGTIGKAGFSGIEDEVQQKFGENILALDYPCHEDDQFVFLRFILRHKEEQIKVEIIQNMLFTEPMELLDDVRVLTYRDIGMLKLMAASNRCSFKDIYDLSYLTNEISLPELFFSLKQKQEQYNKAEHQNIFDQDNEKSPVQDPTLLLRFDTQTQRTPERPFHSTHRFNIVDGISWPAAKSDWRSKVRNLFRYLGIPFRTIK